VLRPLYYLCKLFGLATYSYTGDRRNKGVTTHYGYLNYMFTVIWLTVFSVGLPVEILTIHSVNFGSQILYVAFMLCTNSSYTSGMVAVIWVSIIKRKMLLKIIKYISEVDNKIRCTLQEETFVSRNVLVNIISEITLLSVINSSATVYNIYQIASEPYYIIVIDIIGLCP